MMCVPLVVALALAFFTIIGPAASASAQTALPDVDLALVLEVRDTGDWLNLYEEVLGTAKDLPKPLGVSVAAGTGGRRSILLMQPKFTVSMTSGTMKVTVFGKVSGNEALAGLVPFQQAVLEMQASGAQNQAALAYGLSVAAVNVLELHLTRQ